MRLRQAAICALLSVGLTVACGDSNGDGTPSGQGSSLSASTAQSYEGVYEATVLTENDAGCEGAGTDLLASTAEPYFALVTQEFFGIHELTLVSCVDVTDCQDKATRLVAMEAVMYDYGASVSEQISEDELSGFTAWTGIEQDGVCVDREGEEFVLTRTGDTVHIERSTFALADKPPDSEGFCVAEPAVDRQEAATAPCVSSAVIEGRRVADL
jgi:hypothetical protein